MAVEDNNNDIMNINDPLDINELAALNDDISNEFIEQLQNQITKNSKLIEKKPKKDVSTLFEEVDNNEQKNSEEEFVPHIDTSIDDNFIKKYKAKIEKQRNALFKEAEEEKEKQKEQKLKKKEEEEAKAKAEAEAKARAEKENLKQQENEQRKKEENLKRNVQENANKSIETSPIEATQVSIEQPIESLTNGNIIEKQATAEQIEYNESLDLLDDNIKYSKYVIYIDPENTEFIESLTVKERKNLINRILKEQDNIVITKKRFNTIQTCIKHAIIAILTIAIATPIIYFTINASLEATINNHRRSQTIFKTLYKEKGKIKNVNY